MLANYDLTYSSFMNADRSHKLPGQKKYCITRVTVGNLIRSTFVSVMEAMKIGPEEARMCSRWHLNRGILSLENQIYYKGQQVCFVFAPEVITISIILNNKHVLYIHTHKHAHFLF